MLPRSAAGSSRGGCFAVPKVCMVLTGSLVSGFRCCMLTSCCAQPCPWGQHSLQATPFHPAFLAACSLLQSIWAAALPCDAHLARSLTACNDLCSWCRLVPGRSRLRQPRRPQSASARRRLLNAGEWRKDGPRAARLSATVVWQVRNHTQVMSEAALHWQKGHALLQRRSLFPGGTGSSDPAHALTMWELLASKGSLVAYLQQHHVLHLVAPARCLCSLLASSMCRKVQQDAERREREERARRAEEVRLRKRAAAETARKVGGVLGCACWACSCYDPLRTADCL